MRALARTVAEQSQRLRSQERAPASTRWEGHRWRWPRGHWRDGAVTRLWEVKVCAVRSARISLRGLTAQDTDGSRAGFCFGEIQRQSTQNSVLSAQIRV